jgi:hypothetical protein
MCPLFAEKISKHKQLRMMCHLSNKHTRQFVLRYRQGKRYSDAINKRQDDVYHRLYDEFNSLSLVPLNEIKYHGSCYKAYARKKYYNSLSAMFQNDASVSTMKTRSKTLPHIN